MPVDVVPCYRIFLIDVDTDFDAGRKISALPSVSLNQFVKCIDKERGGTYWPIGFSLDLIPRKTTLS